MRTLALLLHGKQAVQAFLIIAVSVLLAVLLGTGRANQVVMLGGAALFLLLVWDLRLIIPLQIILVPLGPWYEMWFGNLYVATPVMIIACVAWLVRNFISRRPFSFPRNPVLPALVVFLMVLGLSALQDLGGLLYQLPMFLKFIQFFFYAALFIMILQLDLSRRFIRSMLILAVAVGVAEGAVGAAQWLINPGFYVYGTFIGHHSSFAIYIVFVSMLLLGILFETPRATVALAVLAGLGVLMFSFIFSFSRTGYLAIAAGIAAFLCMPGHGRRKIAVLAGVAAIALISYPLIPEDIRMRAGSIVSNLSGRDIGISFRARLNMWEDALYDFRVNPLLGRGAWTYVTTDNFYLKLLGEAGILGLVTFLWLLYSIVRQTVRAARTRVDDVFVRGVVTGLVPATIACILVFNLAGDMFGVHRFMGTYWIVLALTQRYCLAQSQAGVGNA